MLLKMVTLLLPYNVSLNSSIDTSSLLLIFIIIHG